MKFSNHALLLRTALAVTTLAISGCGGGDDNASMQCAFIGGTASAGMTLGGESNVQAAVDKNLSTAGTFSAAGNGMYSANGRQFEAGGLAGLFVTPPQGASSQQWTLTTSLGTTPGDTATGPALIVSDTAGRTTATTYIGLRATRPFNRIEFQFNGSGEYLVFEFCGDAKPAN